MDRLHDLSAFVAVAETGSFTHGAQRRAETTAATSKAVRRLERSLGTRLFLRTTRRVRLTAEGERLLPHARSILAAVERAEEELSDSAHSLAGRLRISASVALGERVVVPLLARFRALHPGIVLELQLRDETSDLVAEGIDVAVRFGPHKDSRLVARRLGRTRHVTCASPGYLARHGTPRTPSELERHVCIAYRSIDSGLAFPWQFVERGRRRSFTPRTSLSVSGGNASAAMARSDLGVIQELGFIVHADLESHALRQVLPEFSAAGPEVALVYLPSDPLPTRVRALIAFLSQELDPRRLDLPEVG